MILVISEVEVIQNAIDLTLKELEGELETRTGFTKEEILAFRQRVIMNATITDKEDLIIINQVLNEVCNGFRINDFLLTVGQEKEFVLHLLERVHSAAVS